MTHSWEALSIQRKTEVAWVDLKIEITVMLSTGNGRSREDKPGV